MTNSILRYDHSYFSDLHKEVHGGRPRFRLDDGSCSQWEIDNYIEHLHDVLTMQQEDAEEAARIQPEEDRWEAFIAPPEPDKYEDYC